MMRESRALMAVLLALLGHSSSSKMTTTVEYVPYVCLCVCVCACMCVSMCVCVCVCVCVCM